MRLLRLITFARLAAMAGVTLAATAAAAAPTSVASWNAERARLFSSVCMKAAPGFTDVGRLAGKVGFHDVDGHVVFDPEVVVSLQSNGRSCTCYMTMGAPDPNALVQAIFEKLLADFPESWRPDSENGTINDTQFARNGVMVNMTLTPSKVDGQYWIAGRVTAPGACPG